MVNYIQLLQEIISGNLLPVSTTVTGAVVSIVGIYMASVSKNIKTEVKELRIDIKGLKVGASETKNDLLDVKSKLHKTTEDIKEVVAIKDINRSIEYIISHALNYCANSNNLMPFCEAVGKTLKDFTSDILLTGFNNVSAKDIRAKFSSYYIAIDNWHNRFDSEFIKSVKPTLKEKSNKYVNSVIEIKTDIVNNKPERFKDVTKVYLQEKISFFINKYTEWNSKV